MRAREEVVRATEEVVRARAEAARAVAVGAVVGRVAAAWASRRAMGMDWAAWCWMARGVAMGMARRMAMGMARVTAMDQGTVSLCSRSHPLRKRPTLSGCQICLPAFPSTRARRPATCL